MYFVEETSNFVLNLRIGVSRDVSGKVNHMQYYQAVACVALVALMMNLCALMNAPKTLKRIFYLLRS